MPPQKCGLTAGITHFLIAAHSRHAPFKIHLSRTFLCGMSFHDLGKIGHIDV
jgi:hypothetical protein